MAVNEGIVLRRNEEFQRCLNDVCARSLFDVERVLLIRVWASWWDPWSVLYLDQTRCVVYHEPVATSQMLAYRKISIGDPKKS